VGDFFPLLRRNPLGPKFAPFHVETKTLDSRVRIGDMYEVELGSHPQPCYQRTGRQSISISRPVTSKRLTLGPLEADAPENGFKIAELRSLRIVWRILSLDYRRSRRLIFFYGGLHQSPLSPGRSRTKRCCFSRSHGAVRARDCLRRILLAAAYTFYAARAHVGRHEDAGRLDHAYDVDGMPGQSLVGAGFLFLLMCRR